MWSKILTSDYNTPYFKNVISFLKYDIKTIRKSNEYELYNNTRINRLFMLLYNRTHILLTEEQNELFLMIASRFTTSRGKKFFVSRNNLLNLALINLTYKRYSIYNKLERTFRISTITEVFQENLIDCIFNNHLKVYNLRFIDVIFKNLPDKFNDIMKLFEEKYYETNLSELKDKSYILLHYVAKHNLEFNNFLLIDEKNKNTKYIKDNFNYKPYDYYLMNWNHEILNNMEQDRNLFSEAPLFKIYFKLNKNYELADVDLMIKLFKLDNENLKENLLILAKKENPLLAKKFFSKLDGILFEKTLKLVIKFSEFPKRLITYFYNCEFKNKIIVDNIYEIVKQLIYNQKDKYSRVSKLNEKIYEKIESNLDVIKYLLSTYSFSIEIFKDKFYEIMISRYRSYDYFVSNKHYSNICNIMFDTKRYYKFRKKILVGIIFNELDRYSSFYKSNTFNSKSKSRKRKLF